MVASFIRQAQRNFYLRHTIGVTQQTPFGELQRRYWMQYLGDASITNQTSYRDLEIRWMKKWMNDNGVTPPNTKYMATLWKYLVTAAGKIPSTYIADNELAFYLNAP